MRVKVAEWRFSSGKADTFTWVPKVSDNLKLVRKEKARQG